MSETNPQPAPLAGTAGELAALRIAGHNVRLRAFLLRLLDPEDLGHAVTHEVRQLARGLVINARGE